MLKIKALVFVQDEWHDDDGVHITDLYNRKAVMMIMPRPMQSAEECIKENISRTLSRIMEDVERTMNYKQGDCIRFNPQREYIDCCDCEDCLFQHSKDCPEVENDKR